MGYPTNRKGYKLYDLETHAIFSSRDIIFYKNIFPYSSSSGSDCSQPILCVLVSHYDYLEDCLLHTSPINNEITFTEPNGNNNTKYPCISSILVVFSLFTSKKIHICNCLIEAGKLWLATKKNIFLQRALKT